MDTFCYSRTIISGRFKLITPPNPPWLKSVLTHYSRGAVWPTVIQAQLGPHIVTLCTGTASQKWLMGGGQADSHSR